MNITTTRYRIGAAMLLALVLTQGGGAVYRSIQNAKCANGNRESCKQAAVWGYKPGPLTNPLHDRASCQATGGTWVGNHPGVCIYS
jgi:hypothetical protein